MDILDIDEIAYTEEPKNILYSAGEYLVLANSVPYINVKAVTGITESLIDSGTGTIFKKEFRYSIDSVSFSEFQEINSANLLGIGSFDRIWFQFRYILLSGGPVTINRIDINYTVQPSTTIDNYVAPNITDESRVYAFPVSYKSNFLWEPYKMNRAVRLYKDLNLMVNTLFGHDTTYYRALPQGRSKDVVLMEYSLYEHDEGRCVKVIVPENAFPDNKLNMGPLGVDFDLPFEIQIDKDYFQTIFGNGSGPQKRDILYFPRTGRIYEILSSYLYRDFMNEPLYFKISLVKWLPKSNAEQSESLDNLEDFTVGAQKLFGDILEEETLKVTDPIQNHVAYASDDPIRSYLYEKQSIIIERVDNYYTVIAEQYYDMKSPLDSNLIAVDIDTTSLTKNTMYYARLIATADYQASLSVKKLTYLGLNYNNKAVFEYTEGKSQLSINFPINTIFSSTSQLSLYLLEHDPDVTDDSVVTCATTNYSNKYYKKVVEYKNSNEFIANSELAYSGWFKTVTSIENNINLTSFSYDVNLFQITIVLSKPKLYFINDIVNLTRISGTNFAIFGKIISIINDTTYVIEVDPEIHTYVASNFSNWTTYINLQAQLIHPRNFISSLSNDKGIQIDLYNDRHIKIYMNDTYSYFSISNSSTVIENDKWHAIFINFSNVFKQLTVNIWKLQWDSVTKLPATTELQLLFNKVVAITNIDRSSNIKFYINPSYMMLTNIRVFNRVAETDKQTFILNQNIVKDAQWAIVIDNALPQSNLPYISYTH